MKTILENEGRIHRKLLCAASIEEPDTRVVNPRHTHLRGQSGLAGSVMGKFLVCVRVVRRPRIVYLTRGRV